MNNFTGKHERTIEEDLIYIWQNDLQFSLKFYQWEKI